jgi:hypothetical protein
MCRKRDSSEEEEEGQAQDHRTQGPGHRISQAEEVTLPREEALTLQKRLPLPQPRAGGQPTLRPGPLTGLRPEHMSNQLTSQDPHPSREGPRSKEPPSSLRVGLLTTLI